MTNNIKTKIIETQNKWAEGVVAIGGLMNNMDECKKAAKDFIKEMYAYEFTTVIFKPTKAAEIQFRGTPESALSYFVGSNPNYSEDNGFALAPWKKIVFDNQGFIIDYDMLCASGNYYFTDSYDNTIKVEYTMGFIKDKNGKLKINLHHSSLPYSPQ
ncbi:MAG: hypothetical protein MI922_09015 [Bacteroidales bacterium]|nr:hypothetical protein [Bacteroidales bacterium]